MDGVQEHVVPVDLDADERVDYHGEGDDDPDGYVVGVEADHHVVGRVPAPELLRYR